MISKEAFVAQVDRAAATMPDLPVSSALLRFLSEQLKNGDPPWWLETSKAWAGRTFIAWTEAFGLFLSAVHFEALSDAENPLVRYFPSCGGTAEADPSGAFARFLAQPPKSFFRNLKDRHRRVYVQARAPVWMAPAALFFQRRNLPYYLVEVNAGAGLNLAADLIQPLKGFRSDLVAARIGVDPDPLSVSDLDQRRWLTAGILPDQTAMIAALDSAIDKLQERLRKEAAFVQLAPCPTAKAPHFAAKNIPSDDPDVGLLIFNVGTTARMSDSDYAAYQRDVGRLLQPWGDRALWVEMEGVRGELYSTTYQIRLFRCQNGALYPHVAASFDAAGQKAAFDQEATARFLAAAPAPRPA